MADKGGAKASYIVYISTVLCQLSTTGLGNFGWGNQAMHALRLHQLSTRAGEILLANFAFLECVKILPVKFSFGPLYPV